MAGGLVLAAVGMTREARIVPGPGVRVIAGGGRADVLERRLTAALEDVAAIISIGVGGALDPALEVGDVVVGSEVLRPRGRWIADPAWTERLLQALPGARRVSIYGANDMILSVLDKAKLRARGGAGLADMESHIAARIAAARGLPFAVVRVVSDTAGLSLPSAVLQGLKPDGGMNLVGVLGALARHPGQLPALLRVGRDADIAMKALAAARARLGPRLAFEDGTA
jgi:hopanoid-associated phosphorylase